VPPVVQLTISFGAGLWSGLLFALPLMPVLVLLGVSAALCLNWRWRGFLSLGLTLGFATAWVVGAGDAHECRVVWKPGPTSALIRIHDTPGSSGVTRASVLHSARGCTGTIRLRVDSAARVQGGSRALVVGEYRGRGMLKAGHLRVLKGSRSPLFLVRDKIASRIRTLYGSRAGLVEAVVLGRREDIDKSIREGFARSGLAHLLAISGLHVGVLGGWCVLLARIVGARRRAWAWGVGIVWLYVASLGFPAPATRAACFLSIVGAAKVRQRHPPPGAVLAVALLVVMTIDPTAASSAGAWLSAAAVWGTRSGIEALGKFRLLGASLGATIATAPITAFAFGSVAPIGILANLAAVPLAGVAVPGLFLSLFVGDIVAGGTGFVFAVLERVAMLGARLPGGNVVGTPGVQFALPWFALCCFAAWLQSSKPKWVLVRRRILGVSALACWAAVALAFTTHPDRSDDLLFYFLSVGQGDAIAIRTPRGEWVVVDGGPRTVGFDAGRAVVLPFLRRNGVTRLSTVVVTHGDSDHLGGIPAVVQELEPRLVLDPGQPIGTDLYLDYLRSLDMAGSEWRAARAGDSFVVDSVRFEVLHPSRDWISREVSPNENSVVLRVTYRCFKVLLTGDIGRPAESILQEIVGEADLLKVAHHGSAGSTDESWLDAVRPRMAVISVGRNRFGHPAPEVLRRLESAAVAVFRTDIGGTVTIRSNGSYFESVQGETMSLSERLLWLIHPWLRSSASSSSKKGNTRTQRVNLPACSLTLP